MEVYYGFTFKSHQIHVENIMAKKHSFVSVKRVDSEEAGRNTAKSPLVSKMHASTVKNYRDATGMLAN